MLRCQSDRGLAIEILRCPSDSALRWCPPRKFGYAKSSAVLLRRADKVNYLGVSDLVSTIACNGRSMGFAQLCRWYRSAWFTSI